MSDVFISGKKFRLDPAQAVGKGGEADVYKVGPRLVAKIFKRPDHPDVAGNPQEEKAALMRIAEHQKKLRQFPLLVGMNVVAPQDLVTDGGGMIVGYTMEFLKDAEVLLKWSERGWRESSKIDNNRVAELFLELSRTLHRIHDAGVVVGDFNDLNVLVQEEKSAWLIDADSFQFGPFLCRVFTEKFVDPLLCDPKGNRPSLVKPHNAESDWYAFNVMLFKALLYCDPYGGIYKPQKKADEVLHAARPLHRITVFDKDVKYPKPAVPIDRLSTVFLDHFEMVFKEDRRRDFPEILLKDFRWTKCTACGSEHGCQVCPVCKKAAPAAVKQTVQVRGKVTSTRIFKTEGEIVFAAWQDGELRWLYHEGGAKYIRESGSSFSAGTEKPTRFRISGRDTLVGVGNKMHIVTPRNHPAAPQEYLFVDQYRNVPLFDANSKRFFWIQNGVLNRDTEIGPELIGTVLENQTLFWTGTGFGFGFYRAGQLSMAFVFESEKGRLNDTKLPSLRGHLLDATCYFTEHFCWFFVSLKEETRMVNRCFLMKRDGTIEASAQADQGDGSWLGEIRGKCAAGPYLFSVTDDGIVRLQSGGTTIIKTAEYPDTEPFVHTGCHLHPAKDGLHVVDRSEIRLIKIG